MTGGIIYLISSPNTDKVYIGSTTQKLTRRFNTHKSVYNTSRSKIIIESGDAVITVIDNIEDKDREELKIKEIEYIQFYKDICVNFHGTKNSYSKEYKRPCRLDGRKKKQQRIKNDCCICGGRYTNAKKQQHFKTKKHLEKSLELTNSKDV